MGELQLQPSVTLMHSSKTKCSNDTKPTQISTSIFSEKENLNIQPFKIQLTYELKQLIDQKDWNFCEIILAMIDGIYISTSVLAAGRNGKLSGGKLKLKLVWLCIIFHNLRNEKYPHNWQQQQLEQVRNGQLGRNPSGAQSVSDERLEVQAVRMVKFPVFYKADVQFWFTQVESEFNITGITRKHSSSM